MNFLCTTVRPFVATREGSASAANRDDVLSKLLARQQRWTEKEQTQAEVTVLILDHVFAALPTPPKY